MNKDDIEIGARICVRIKDAYFKDVHWSKCCKELARKFSAFKKITRPFYSDKNSTEFLLQLDKFSTEDIIDAFNDDSGSLGGQGKDIIKSR